LTSGTGVGVNEVPDMLRDRDAFDIAAGLDFGRDIYRDVIRPMLKCVEGNNADRVVKLAC
jgi:hypothetical protein